MYEIFSKFNLINIRIGKVCSYHISTFAVILYYAMNNYYLNEKKYYCPDTKETCIGYKNYLQTEHWKNFRLSVISSRKKCQCCGTDDGIMHVHHLSYKNVGKEKSGDVALLCNNCHEHIHKIKSGEEVCSDEAILRLVKKEPRKKKTVKHTNERTCKNCVFFTRSAEGGKKIPLCTKTMIYYPETQMQNCKKFVSNYNKAKPKANKKK